MAENKSVEKAASKEVVKTDPAPLVKTEKTGPAVETAKADAPKAEVKLETRTGVKKEVKKENKTDVKSESKVKTEVKTETRNEVDPAKEFVDGIMAEMALKGASKKRLIKMLVDQYGMDKQRVMFKLKRALITERYAAAHAEAAH